MCYVAPAFLRARLLAGRLLGCVCRRQANATHSACRHRTFPCPKFACPSDIPSPGFSFALHLPVLTDGPGRFSGASQPRQVMGWKKFLSAVLDRLAWRVYCSARFWIEAFFDNRLQPQEARALQEHLEVSGIQMILAMTIDSKRRPLVRHGCERFVGAVVAERASQRYGAAGEVGS